VLAEVSWPAKKKINELPITSCLVKNTPLESAGLFSEAFTRGPIDVRFYKTASVGHTHEVHSSFFGCLARLKLLSLLLR
jgi:hypothetical protein